MDQKKGQAITDVGDGHPRHRYAIHRGLEQPRLDVADQERQARRCRSLRVPDSNGASPTAIHSIKSDRGVLHDPGWPRPAREARVQPSPRVSINRIDRGAQLHLLVSGGAHDQLRRRARREGRGDEKRVDPGRGQSETFPRC